MESARQTSSPAPAEEAQELRLYSQVSLQRPFPSPFSACSVGPEGAAHQLSSEGAVCFRTGAMGGGGSQQPGPSTHFIRPWTHTHTMLLDLGPLRSVRESQSCEKYKTTKGVQNGFRAGRGQCGQQKRYDTTEQLSRSLKGE